MAQAHSLCLVQKGSLSPPQAVQALKITLQDLGIDPAVLTNPLVEAVSPRFQALLDADCSLESRQPAVLSRLAQLLLPALLLQAVIRRLSSSGGVDAARF